MRRAIPKDLSCPACFEYQLIYSRLNRAANCPDAFVWKCDLGHSLVLVEGVQNGEKRLSALRMIRSGFELPAVLVNGASHSQNVPFQK